MQNLTKSLSLNTFLDSAFFNLFLYDYEHGIPLLYIQCKIWAVCTFICNHTIIIIMSHYVLVSQVLHGLCQGPWGGAGGRVTDIFEDDNHTIELYTWLDWLLDTFPVCT